MTAKFQCQYCMRIFLDRELLDDHIIDVHYYQRCYENTDTHKKNWGKEPKASKR